MFFFFHARARGLPYVAPGGRVLRFIQRISFNLGLNRAKEDEIPPRVVPFMAAPRGRTACGVHAIRGFGGILMRGVHAIRGFGGILPRGVHAIRGFDDILPIHNY